MLPHNIVLLFCLSKGSLIVFRSADSFLPCRWRAGQSDMVPGQWNVNGSWSFQESSLSRAVTQLAWMFRLFSSLFLPAWVAVTMPGTAGAILWAQGDRATIEAHQSRRTEAPGHWWPRGTVTPVLNCKPLHLLLCENSKPLHDAVVVIGVFCYNRPRQSVADTIRIIFFLFNIWDQETVLQATERNNTTSRLKC